jgi:hypothetical protein
MIMSIGLNKCLIVFSNNKMLNFIHNIVFKHFLNQKINIAILNYFYS